MEGFTDVRWYSTFRIKDVEYKVYTGYRQGRICSFSVPQMNLTDPGIKKVVFEMKKARQSRT